MASLTGGSVVWNFDVDSTKFNAGLAKASSEIDAIGGKMKTQETRLGSAFGSLSKQLVGLTVGLTAAGIAGGLLGKKALDMTSDFQQSRIAFDTMLGSAEKGAKIMRQLSEFAKKTPFSLPEVVQGAKGLLAYGVAAEKILPTFNALGSIAAGVGKDKLPQLTLAFGQVRTAGKLTGMELRQFTEAGVPLLQVIAKQAGKTAAQIKEEMEDGAAPSFAQVEKAIFSMSQKGGKFYGLLEAQSKTFSGRMSNISDSVGQSIRGILGVDVEGNVQEGGIFDRVTKAAEGFMNWLETNKGTIISFGQSILSNVVPAVAALAAGFVTLAGATAVIGIANVIGQFTKFFTLVKGGTGVMAAFNAVTAVNPFVLLAYGIAAIVAGLVFLEVKFGVFSKLWGKLMEAAKPVIDWFQANVMPVLSQIAKFVGEQLKKAWDDFSTAMKTLWAQLQPIMPQLKILGIILGVVLLTPLLVIIATIALFVAAIVAIIVVVARVIGWFAKLIAAVTTIGIAIWNAIKTAFMQIWLTVSTVATQIWQKVVTVFTAIWTFLTVIWNAILFVIKWAIAIILAVVFAWLKLIWTIITAVWTRIWAFFGPILKAIWSIIVSVFNAIKGVVTRVFTAVWTFIVSVWNRVYSAVSGAVNRVLNAVRSAFNAVWSVVSSIWNRISSTIKGAVDRVVNVVSGIKDKVKNAVSGAVNWLVDAGKQIMNGLINGVKSMGGTVKNAITDFVKSNVPGPVLKVLGISSPSKLFAKYGLYTAQGFAQGIDRGSGLVSSAMDRLAANNMIAPMAPDVTGGGGSRVSNVSASTEIGTINVYKEADENRLLGKLTRQQEALGMGLVSNV